MTINALVNIILIVDYLKKNSLYLIIILGLVSLFSDMTYEGARSINGAYLGMLGTSAVVVGFVGGLGEFLGYGIRLFSGKWADKTKKYWALTILGYSINLLSVPLIALFPFWQWAIFPMLFERIGKGIRVPPRDAMISFASKSVGRGFGFGLHEFLDQLGAVSGPMIVMLTLYIFGTHNFRSAFFVLAIPAVCALLILAVARLKYPAPSNLEIRVISIKTEGLPKLFWIYCFSVLGFAVGFLDFALLSFHFEKTRVITLDAIPAIYAFAMAVDGISALVFGKLFDKNGYMALLSAIIISIFANPLIFLFHSVLFVIIGTALWGIGLGALESIVRAAVANIVPQDKRGSAYGIFNSLLGVFWFVGSFICGILYEVSVLYMVAFSVFFQFISIISFIYYRKQLILK